MNAAMLQILNERERVKLILTLRQEHLIKYLSKENGNSSLRELNLNV